MRSLNINKLTFDNSISLNELNVSIKNVYVIFINFWFEEGIKLKIYTLIYINNGNELNSQINTQNEFS